MGLVVDPVCGMEFSQNVAVAHSEYLDRTFYFCHPACKKIFDIKPSRFVYREKSRRRTRRTNCNADDTEFGTA